MDFDADYDSGKIFYKNDQPTHFFEIFSFFDFFSKFLLFRTILDQYGAHVKALQKLHRLTPKTQKSDVPSARCEFLNMLDIHLPMLNITDKKILDKIFLTKIYFPSIDLKFSHHMQFLTLINVSYSVF